MTIKKLIIVSLTLFPVVGNAQIFLDFSSRKAAHQSGKKTLTYVGGDFSIFTADGNAYLAPCGGHPSPVRILPSPGCGLGTTGYVSFGDLDGDGVRDDGSFWSLIAAPTPATIIKPFHTVGLRVESAPPSEFIRPAILPVNDGSLVVWYNTLDALNQRQYDISAYTYFQSFAATPSGRASHDRTVTSGGYTFSVPWIGDPNGIQRQVIGLNKLPMPEAYPGLVQSPLKSGFRFTNDTWNESNQLQFDPRMFNDLTWEGMLPGQDLFPVADQIRLWMLATPSVDPFEFPSTILDPNVVFPPAAGVILFQDPTVTSYRLPGLFFVPGDTARLYLRLDRSLPTGIASDLSVRVWSIDVAFIDTYEGFSTLSGGFPSGTTAEERSADFDFDGDGFSNLIEFAMSSDPADVADVPTTTPAGVGGGAPGTFVITPLVGGFCEVEVTKRPDVGTSLTYFIEHSDDMVTWTRVPLAGNASWTVVDTAASLKVTSLNPITNPPVVGGPVNCFFRVAVELN